MELVKENIGNYTFFHILGDDIILGNHERSSLKFCYNNLEVYYEKLKILKKKKLVFIDRSFDRHIYDGKGNLIKTFFTHSYIYFSDNDEIMVLSSPNKLVFLDSGNEYNFNFYFFFDDYILFHYNNKIYHYTYDEKKIFEKEFINDKICNVKITDDGYVILHKEISKLIILDKDYNIIFKSDNCYCRFNDDYIHVIENNNCYRFQINKLPSK